MSKIYTFAEFINEAKKMPKMQEEKPKAKKKKEEKAPAKKAAKKKKDQDGDGDTDFADAKIAQYTAGGMDKKKAVAASRKFNK
jgi:hypothetical protein